jgi:hypothetical protein
MRSSQHSDTRNPPPSINAAINHTVPRKRAEQRRRFRNTQHDRQMRAAFGSRRQRQALRFGPEDVATQETESRRAPGSACWPTHVVARPAA